MHPVVIPFLSVLYVNISVRFIVFHYESLRAEGWPYRPFALMFEIMQLNCHKSKCVSSNLVNEIFQETSGQLALLQEPHCYRVRPTSLGRSLKVITGGGDCPRTAIAVTKDIPIWFS